VLKSATKYTGQQSDTTVQCAPQFICAVGTLTYLHSDLQRHRQKHDITSWAVATAGILVSLEPIAREALEKLSSLTRLLMLPDWLPWLSSYVKYT